MSSTPYPTTSHRLHAPSLPFLPRPLHIAARNGLASVVQALLSRGATVLAVDEEGGWGPEPPSLLGLGSGTFFRRWLLKLVINWVSFPRDLFRTGTQHQHARVSEGSLPELGGASRVIRETLCTPQHPVAHALLLAPHFSSLSASLGPNGPWFLACLGSLYR